MFEETWECAHCDFEYESPIGVSSVGHWCTKTGFRVWRLLTVKETSE